MKNKPYRILLLLLGIMTLASCKQQHQKDEIEAAMKHYDRLIKRMDADSIAILFTPDGNLGGMAHGQDAIRKFLATFKGKNIQVIATASTTRFIAIAGDTALQKGSYRQVDLIGGRDTIKVKGNYIANWQWNKENGWRLKQMQTQPTK